jgi:serine/threonine-protein kinase
MAAALESRSKQSTQLGRYALFDQIAEGGMATVHLGRLIGPVGFSKIVAIKQMHESAARNPDFVAMFLDEARLSGRVQHPNVVATYDVIAKGGEAFLVMEYVHGESLAALLRAARKREQRLAPAVAVHILCDVLSGLHAAHEATDEFSEPLRIVHRDVSPQNIMVGVDGVARVLDFGIAKAAGRMQETQTGQLKGKIGYMAPEQLLGRPLDRRVDIFAAGIVLWETISGRKMFDADNSGQLMYQVLEFDIPPLSTLADVPLALSRAVERATARDPNERFATAREFARELERSTALVSAREIGEWVSELCGEALDRRAEQVRAIESAPVTSSSAIVTRGGLGLPTDEDSYRRASGDALTEPAAAADPVTAETQIALPRSRSRSRLIGGLLAAGLTLSVLAFVALHSGSAPQPTPAQANGATSVATPTLAPAPPSIVAVTSTGQTEPASDLHPPPPATTATQAPTSKKTTTTRHPVRPPSKRPEDLFSRK